MIATMMHALPVHRASSTQPGVFKQHGHWLNLAASHS